MGAIPDDDGARRRSDELAKTDAAPAGAGRSDPAHTATAAGEPATAGAGLTECARLGHFLIHHRVGAGGMGEVYLATDLALDRQVAVKVLPGGAASRTARDRMIREARAQARIQHAHVAHIYFIGEEGDRLYFAMEYVKGRTLAEIAAEGPMPLDDALGVVHDAALGLREAQASGFTHRDVKPSNLMRDARGVVKVLDFGLAAGAPERAGDGPIAQTTLAGTPLYMAPEQARGEPVDFRADIYALGATLYQLVSGRPPFVADTADALVTMHASAPRPAVPRGTGSRVQAAAVDALIAKMMAPRAADRFASYDELLRAIERLSPRYTRPAGFWVRAFAAVIDLMMISVVVAAVAGVLGGGGDVPLASIGMPLLAAVELVSIARLGTTAGGALLELEVVSIATGRRPSWRQAVLRTLRLFGPTVAVGWGEAIAHVLGAPPWLRTTLEVAYPLTFLAIALRLAHAALRVWGKRTVWDRASATMMRYRTSAGAAAR